MAITDISGFSVATCLASASTHEVKLAETALDSLFIAEKPEKLIGDKAYELHLQVTVTKSIMIF